DDRASRDLDPFHIGCRCLDWHQASRPNHGALFDLHSTDVGRDLLDGVLMDPAKGTWRRLDGQPTALLFAFAQDDNAITIPEFAGDRVVVLRESEQQRG